MGDDNEAYSDYFIDYKSLMEEIAITEHPQSGYIVRNRPFKISCRAVHARKIRFKCSTKWVDELRYLVTSSTDSSGLPSSSASVDLFRSDIDASATVDDFSCQCYASAVDDVDVVVSEVATVKLAYMRKHFLKTPESQRVLEGSTLQLLCEPPESGPRAEVKWYKDGEPMSAGEGVILASDNSLILSNARLTDSGSYLCEANNLANSRRSEPAQVHVYVNGGWSDWSPWTGSCHVECDVLRVHASRVRDASEVLPHQRRTRTCNNPAPLNGGEYCKGDEETTRECKVPCRLDGGWSTWSDWSTCSDTCRRFRSRACVVPPPINGGRPCFGEDLITEQCPPQMCSIAPPTSSSDTAIYGSMASVVVLAACLIAFFSLFFCRRNRDGKKGVEKNIYYAGSEAHMRRLLYDQQHAALLGDDCSKFSHCSPYMAPSLHPSTTLKSYKSQLSAYSTRNAGSRAALIQECSSSSSSGGKPTVVRTTSSHCSDDDNYATLYDYMEDKSELGLDSSQSIVAANIDERGARLCLRRSGASLAVPEGAVEGEQMIYLAVSDTINDQPKLLPHESALSPVIVVGQCQISASSFRRPVVVSFRHCASTFPRDNWVFSIYTDEGDGWQKAVTIGEENLNTSVFVQFARPGKFGEHFGWCHVMTQSMCRMILVGHSRRTSLCSSKRVHWAVFGPSDRNAYRSPFDLRFYCVPETGAAMESVWKQEEETNSRLLVESDDFVLNERGELCICVEAVADEYVVDANVIEIADSQHLWCSQNGLHCSLHFRPAASPTATRPTEFDARVVVYQKGSSSERTVLNVSNDGDIYDKPCTESEKAVCTSFLLPSGVKNRLCEMLDAPNDRADWRVLAKKLHYDRYLQFFGSFPACSPTSLLLELWEAASSGSARSVHDLLQTLRIMGRADAVELLEQMLSQFPDVVSP